MVSDVRRWFKLGVAAVLAAGIVPLGVVAGSGDVLTEQQARQLDQRVDARIALYSEAFPEIQFVRLDGGSRWRQGLERLARLLGRGAVNLDYEHPEDLRQDLVSANVQRIAAMLRTRSASATLFEPGAGSTAHNDRLCVVTMDARGIAANDAQATRHLLDLPDHTFQRVHASNYLNFEDHLTFVVDHEIYHCLDSNFNGPIPMSRRKFGGAFAFFRNENGADAFGVAMHVRDRGAHTEYAGNLMRIRTLALLNNDPNHFTRQAIGRVLQEDAHWLAGKGPRQLMGFATRVRDAVAADYEHYLEFRAAAREAAQALGAPSKDGGRREEMPKAVVIAADVQDSAVADRLFYYSLNSYRQLFVAADESLWRY